MGYDNPTDSQSALLFAIEEAKLRGARLLVVTTWELPTESWEELPPTDEIMKRYRTEAEEILAEAAATVEREAPNLEVEVMASEGKLGDALLDHAAQAALMVVATRGHGAVTGLLLGSVGHEVIGHAHIPVVVVPSPEHLD